MKKLLYINACIRGEASRTARIARELIGALSERYVIETVDLTESELLSVNREKYEKRASGIHQKNAVEYAKKLAEADRIVIAAPFWDMSFPSVFKVFCENVSISGITFSDGEDGATRGGCRAEKMMLITTRGMEIEDNSPLDVASAYLKALGWLWGIPELTVISAKGMDMCDGETGESRINAAINKGLSVCEDF